MPGPTIYADSEYAGWLLSGHSAEGTATTSLDLRGVPGSLFSVWMSASADGPTANGSAIYTLLHSPFSGSWQPIATVTATKGGTSYTVYSALYGWVTVRLDKVYSAAQTGTAAMFIYVRSVYG